MSKRFVRNIRDTKLTGDKKEPLYTNSQNDILSDGEDVFIRNNKEYHCLTDNIKKITVPDNNDTIKINWIDKNTIEIVGNKQDIPDIPDIPKPLKLVSESENLIVEKIEENNFKLLLNLSEYATKSDLEKIELPDVSDFVTSQWVKNEITKQIGNIDFSYYATKTYVNTEIGKITIPDISEFLTETEIQNLIDTGINNIDLSNYSTKQEITQAIEQAINNIDLSNYYTKEEVETEIQNAINGIDIPEIDLSDYYTKEKIRDMNTLMDINIEDSFILIDEYLTYVYINTGDDDTPRYLENVKISFIDGNRLKRNKDLVLLGLDEKIVYNDKPSEVFSDQNIVEWKYFIIPTPENLSYQQFKQNYDDMLNSKSINDGNLHQIFLNITFTFKHYTPTDTTKIISRKALVRIRLKD